MIASEIVICGVPLGNIWLMYSRALDLSIGENQRNQKSMNSDGDYD